MNGYDGTVVKQLLQEALASESKYATIIRQAYPNYAQAFSDDHMLLRDFIMKQILLRSGSSSINSLSYSQPGPNGTAQFRLYNPSYILNGQTYTLSETRHQTILDLYRQIGYDDNGNRILTSNNQIPDNIIHRLEAILWEEAGEKAVDLALNSQSFQQMFGNVNNSRGVPYPAQWNVAQSNNFRWDTTIEYYLPKFDEQGYYMPLTGIMGKLKLEHKDSMINFHIADSTISDINLWRLGESGINIKEYIGNVILIDRIKSVYPIYYSMVTQDILFSSEMLMDNNFNLEGLDVIKAERLANNIFSAISRASLYKNAENGDVKQFLIDKTINQFQKMRFQVSLWYGK